jgi:hypothetical protein
MKTILLVLSLLLLAVPSYAQAWSQQYTWSTDPLATSYKVEKSVDAGVTWTQVGTPTTPTITYTGSETGTVLFRVSNCDAAGCTTRSYDGFWHNESWRPAGWPSNLQAP